MCVLILKQTRFKWFPFQLSPPKVLPPGREMPRDSSTVSSFSTFLMLFSSKAFFQHTFWFKFLNSLLQQCYEFKVEINKKSKLFCFCQKFTFASFSAKMLPRKYEEGHSHFHSHSLQIWERSFSARMLPRRYEKENSTSFKSCKGECVPLGQVLHMLLIFLCFFLFLFDFCLFGQVFAIF